MPSRNQPAVPGDKTPQLALERPEPSGQRPH